MHLLSHCHRHHGPPPIDSVLNRRKKVQESKNKSEHPSVFIEPEYRERTRPSRPRMSEPSLISIIKIRPEEWLQLPIALTIGPGLGRSDIYVTSILGTNLIPPAFPLPRRLRFASPEIIPLHLQLSGPLLTLQEILRIGLKLDRTYYQMSRISLTADRGRCQRRNHDEDEHDPLGRIASLASTTHLSPF